MTVNADNVMFILTAGVIIALSAQSASYGGAERLKSRFMATREMTDCVEPGGGADESYLFTDTF